MTAASTAPVRQGRAFTGFATNVLSRGSLQVVTTSAFEILNSAIEYGAGSTGLVVGRVQSGKTLSYEAVASLARDNGYALVIVITGKSNALLAQGERRLKSDLSRADPTGWLFLSPADKNQRVHNVRDELRRVQENWDDPTTPAAYKQTAVVTLLKHGGRISDLAGLFDSTDFRQHRVLIIDDEADQASLNTAARRGKKSPTYGSILSLRNSLPSHNYLQYTATPQAPLLIAIDDALSPDFVHVLQPGSDYIGGDAYFDTSSKTVSPIKPTDLVFASRPGGEIPPGLRLAAMQFLVGVCHTISLGSPTIRSMLVHPSRETSEHREFAHWLRRLVETWADYLLHADEVRPKRLEEEFASAWSDIRETFPRLADLKACWTCLPLALRNLDIIELNTRTGPTPHIQWADTKSYILVGGDAIDRGFTVEGLTVTYMSRPVGMSLLDTIQQRGRFFGYKREYFGLCRVHLDGEVHDVFDHYVSHERDMLASLRSIAVGESTLKEWRRSFLLHPRMKATRASVIDLPVLHVTQKHGWISDRYPIRDDALPSDIALEALDYELSDAKWAATNDGHLLTHISLHSALKVLTSISPDSLLSIKSFQALSVQLAFHSENDYSADSVAVYKMRPKDSPVSRTVGADGQMRLFQGHNKTYVGDRNVFDPSAQLSVQLHEVSLHTHDGSYAGTQLMSTWRVMEKSSTGWLVEIGR